MGIFKCGTVLDVGQDYILAGKIKSGIRGELSVCSWQEKWSECPFLVRWRLLQKQITCRSQRVKSQDNHISLTQNENTLYPNHQQNHMSAPEHQIPLPEQTSNHIPAPEHQIPPADQTSYQMFQISHPKNHIYPSRSHRRQPQSFMDRMMMENHLGMSDPQEHMDYIGGRGRMTMYGYGLSGGSDFYSHFQESMD
ncbi:uncharacterized protein LOC128191207 [Crassostrea angulata]|uniref:uncharacterized protein LOC128191207 n=1 Tax=Magallana angulata TaxID=2784310 RepID=UPI0022B1F43D|nr:uncharacterized protein LOC128191207 [Crassostrea angulata]